MVASSILRRFVALLAAGAVVGAASAGHARDPKAVTATARTHQGRDRSGHVGDADDDGRGHARGRASSIGAPNHGEIVGAVRLRSSAHLEVRDGVNTWGVPPLVKILRRAADEVAAKHKGAVLFIGDLSAKSGGPLAGHRSHQSGRDADVGFFVSNDKGKSVNPRRFVACNGDGRARDTDAHFDDARNWALVEALLENESVRYLFVAPTLRARLLKFAAKKHAPASIVTRAMAALVPPVHGDAHDDHFHLRISCPASSSKCVEESIGQAGPEDIYAEDAPASKPKPAAP